MNSFNQDCSSDKISYRELELRYNTIFNHSMLMNFFVNRDGIIERCNKLASIILTEMRERVNILDCIAQDDLTFFRHHLKDLNSKNDSFSLNVNLKNSSRNLYCKVDAQLFDCQGHLTIFLSFLDQTMDKRRIEEITNLSLHDQLTGLYNRRYFEEEMTRLDCPRYYPLGVIFADMNGLKLINDTFGHEAGDHLLIQVADIFKKFFRQGEIIARLGGDEFTILLPNIDETTLSSRMEHLRKYTDSICLNDIQVSMALGSCLKYDVSEDIREVIRKAEGLMYQKKLYMTANTHKKVIDGVIATLHEKHPREEEHSKRVSNYMVMLAESFDLSENEVTTFRTAGLLHDIGKIAIDYSLLEQQRALTDAEYHEVKKHPEIGYRILKSAGSFAEVIEIVLSHHEKLDGTGYPRGLRGEQISFGARCLCVCDAYDAMTARRPYREPLSHKEACEELQKCVTSQFDPVVVEKFLQLDL